MEAYFEKLEELEYQSPPSVDEGYGERDVDVSNIDESSCALSMSEWSVNDIGKDHVQLTDKSALKPDKSIASMGKRMRQALGQSSTYAESEGDVSYAETDNMSALGDFRLGSVLGIDDTANMSEFGDGTTELGGITEENSQDFTPEKSGKNSDFSDLWKTRVEGEGNDREPVEEVSPAKSIEDEILGVSLAATNAAMKRLKKENNFLDVSHHAPRFNVNESDSEAEDESMLFHERPTTTINEQDELNTTKGDASSTTGSSPSSVRSGPGSVIGSIIGSILGKDDTDDRNLDSLAYLDNRVANNTDGSGDKIIDDDVSDAETSVDMSDVADDSLATKDVNLLSEVASSAGSEEPKFFQMELPDAYKLKDGDDDGADGGSVNDSEYDHSLYEM